MSYKSIYDYLKNIYEKTTAINNESLKFSMRNVHAKGIFSLVIDGSEHGNLTRVFIADKKLKPFEVQFHTHRYPLNLTVINGNITHHTAVYRTSQPVQNPLQLSEFEYRSVLNGGNGLTYKHDSFVVTSEYKLPIGSQINLGINDFHTMSCSKGSIWIVEELGFKIDYSKVLGVPFVVDGLYNEPSMFQVVDKQQLVARKIKEILLQYELLNNK